MNNHNHDNEKCPWNDPETFANPATAGLPCTCKESEYVIKDTFDDPPALCFFPNGNIEQPILVVDEEGMIYKGKRVKDAGEAYKAFMETMDLIVNGKIPTLKEMKCACGWEGMKAELIDCECPKCGHQCGLESIESLIPLIEAINHMEDVCNCDICLDIIHRIQHEINQNEQLKKDNKRLRDELAEAIWGERDGWG
jgi:hypothetical protein